MDHSRVYNTQQKLQSTADSDKSAIPEYHRFVPLTWARHTSIFANDANSGSVVHCVGCNRVSQGKVLIARHQQCLNNVCWYMNLKVSQELVLALITITTAIQTAVTKNSQHGKLCLRRDPSWASANKLQRVDCPSGVGWPASIDR